MDSESGGPQNEKPKSLSKAEFAKLTHGHLNDYIKLADRKASLLLSAHIAYLGLVTTVISSNFQSSPWIFKVSSSVTVLFAALATVFATKAVYPNTPETPQGLILWESIVQSTSDEFRDNIRGKDDDELLTELIDENYALAEVADGKYDDVRKALWCTGVTVISTIVTISQLPTI